MREGRLAVLSRLLGIAFALAAWETAFQLELLNPLIIPGPSLIVAAAASDGGTFLQAFRLTLAEVAAAVLFAWSVGLAGGCVLGSIAALRQVASPILSGLVAVPLVLVYPILLAWIGLGPASKVVYGALSGVFPITLATMAALRTLDLRYRQMARAMGARPWQVAAKVLLPFALPPVVAGLRIGTSLVIIGVVVSEMLASADGLGFWISYHRTLFNTGHVYLGILLTLAIAFAANAALSWLETLGASAPHPAGGYAS
jgi:NitT/TauT family transport system permease protein